MAARIALETYAASVGGGSGAVSKKCCTKTRAEALGCNVSGSYAAKRLVPQTVLSKASVTFNFLVENMTSCLDVDYAVFARIDLINDGYYLDESVWTSSNNLAWDATCNDPYGGFPYTVKWYLSSVSGFVWSEGYKTVTYNYGENVQGGSITVNLSNVFGSSTPMEDTYYLILEDN